MLRSQKATEYMQYCPPLTTVNSYSLDTTSVEKHVMFYSDETEQ